MGDSDRPRYPVRCLRNREDAQHPFKEHLKMKGIRHIVVGISHPQTNSKIERFFGEVERRYHSIGAFPNDAALLRLARSILTDVNEEWITNRRYLSFGEEISCQDTGAEFTV
jgi:transposase-like protein